MTEKEKASLKIRLGKRLSSDKRRIMEIVKEEIDKTETTKERPRGEWIHTEDGECYCTICKVRDWTNSDDYRFCPWCGADMRKRGDENGTDS